MFQDASPFLILWTSLYFFLFRCAIFRKDFLNTSEFYKFYFLVQSSRGFSGSEAFLPSVWKQLLLRDFHKADEMVSLQTKGLQGGQSQAEWLCVMLLIEKKKINKLGILAAQVLILKRINLNPFPAMHFLHNLGPISQHLPSLPNLGAAVGAQRGLMRLKTASAI